MRKFGKTIVDPHITNQTEVKREASRVIIIRDNKLLMIYCAYFDDYTFPGGGTNPGETHIDTLKREALEEGGVLIDNIRPYGYISERWVNERNTKEFIYQRSYYYLADIKEYKETHYEDYEIEYGFKPVWIDVDTAIKQDLIVKARWTENDYEGVQVRELRILNKIKKDFNL